MKWFLHALEDKWKRGAEVFLQLFLSVRNSVSGMFIAIRTVRIIFPKMNKKNIRQYLRTAEPGTRKHKNNSCYFIFMVKRNKVFHLIFNLILVLRTLLARSSNFSYFFLIFWVTVSNFSKFHLIYLVHCFLWLMSSKILTNIAYIMIL